MKWKNRFNDEIIWRQRPRPDKMMHIIKFKWSFLRFFYNRCPPFDQCFHEITVVSKQINRESCSCFVSPAFSREGKRATENVSQRSLIAFSTKPRYSERINKSGRMRCKSPRYSRSIVVVVVVIVAIQNRRSIKRLLERRSAFPSRLPRYAFQVKIGLICAFVLLLTHIRSRWTKLYRNRPQSRHI